MNRGLMILIIVIGIIVVLATHNFLSTRKRWALGALFPALYTGFAIWFMTTKNFDTYMVFKLCLLLVILLGIWADGRAKVKKNLYKELDKMKSKDIL